jgi:hypothetical protein
MSKNAQPRSRSEPPAPAEVNHRFQTWGFIFLFGFMLPAMAIHGLFFDEERGGGILAVAALMGAPIAWWLFREARFRIRVTARGMDIRPLWGEPQEIPWSAIQAVGYRPRTRVVELLLEDPGGEAGGARLQVSLLRENLHVLAGFLTSRVPPSAFDEEAAVLFRMK